MSSEISVNFISDFLRSHVRTLYDRIQETLTKKKWQSGLMGGIFCYLTGRYLYNKLYCWYYQLPPGPFSLIPKIGNTLSTVTNAKWNITWTMCYGQVFSLYEWNKYTIVINDAAIAKQILSNPAAQDRFSNSIMTSQGTLKFFTILAADDNTPSFISLNGKKWRKMRQIMHTKLVRVMNTKSVNEIINQSIKNELEPEFENIFSRKNGDNIWFCRELLSQLTFNVIFRGNFGQNVDFKNNKLCRELANDLVDAVGWNIMKRSVLLFLFPRLAPLIIPSSYFKPCYDLRKRINNNIREMIKDKEKYKEKQSFMDHTHFMAESDGEYTSSQEIADIYLMFIAGTDTTSISIEWGLLLLSRQQDIQNIVRNELLSVMNKNNIDYTINSVNILYDIKLLLQLPLFRALIHEILRISCVARTGLQHIIRKNLWITTKNGKEYKIPKNSQIIYNVEAIHYDVLGNENWKNKKYGKKLQEICLENWLKEESGKFYQNPSFITFGYGKRDCVGKQLAMKEMRVILGYLLLNYKFSIQSKYMKMKYIPCKGGVRAGVAKPFPQIPIIVEKIGCH